MKQFFDDPRGSELFPTLDSFVGYWQIRMAEFCKEMTISTTRSRTHQFQVMPFGLVNALLTFQRTMNVVTQDPPFVRVYIDEAVILSISMEEHVGHIRKVLQRLSDRGLKIEFWRRHSARFKMPLLGHVVSSDDV